MKIMTAPTLRFDIYMAGPIHKARETCQDYCDRTGFCVHVEKCDYIYTNGEETGFKVGIINYPRFPEGLLALKNRAMKLAHMLRERCEQNSFSIVGPHETIFVSFREGD